MEYLAADPAHTLYDAASGTVDKDTVVSCRAGPAVGKGQAHGVAAAGIADVDVVVEGVMRGLLWAKIITVHRIWLRWVM